MTEIPHSQRDLLEHAKAYFLKWSKAYSVLKLDKVQHELRQIYELLLASKVIKEDQGHGH